MPLDTVADTLQALAAQAAAFLALLLAGSALHKGWHWSRSRTAAERFAGMPRPAAGAAAATVIVGECLAAVSLIVPATRVGGALAAAALWSLYLGLIVRAISSGRPEVDCGCSFGARAAAAGAGAHAVGSYHAIRNAVLVAAAVSVAVVSQRIGAGAITGSQALGACALLALYVAVEQVSGLAPLRRGEIL